jgi:NAD(P)H-dependent glutamate synthase small subunit
MAGPGAVDQCSDFLDVFVLYCAGVSTQWTIHGEKLVDENPEPGMPEPEPHEPAEARKKHYREFYLRLDDQSAGVQGARCMDCGIPFCMQGCPVNNIIPDWNDLVYRQDWRSAIEVLHSTNNFPEFTGRICPAPCEEACVLRINEDPVGIKSIEHAIIDKAWEEGWVRAQPAAHKTGKKVAIVGSGPAGLACAQQLARVGHEVTVFENRDRIGGLMRYGIPDFKLEKGVIDRRLEQMRAEGVKFRAGVFVGVQPPGRGVVSDANSRIEPSKLLAEFDAVVLAGGAEQPRDLPIPGRDLAGIHYEGTIYYPTTKVRFVGNGHAAPPSPYTMFIAYDFELTGIASLYVAVHSDYYASDVPLPFGIVPGAQAGAARGAVSVREDPSMASDR